MQGKKKGLSEYTTQEISELSYRQINQIYRDNDESHLYPIFNSFNVTERAIRRIRKQRRQGAEINCGVEYWLAMEHECSDIVNNYP